MMKHDSAGQRWLDPGLVCRHVDRYTAKILRIKGMLRSLSSEDEVRSAEEDAKRIVEDRFEWSGAHDIPMLWDRSIEQLSILQDCRGVLEQAKQPASQGLGKERQRQIDSLVVAIASKLNVAAELSETLEAVTEQENLWRSVIETLKRCRLRYGAINALRFFSDRSGVEAGSIVFAAIVVLGAVYSWCYSWAIGVSVMTYWTMEDLLLTGAKTIVIGVLVFWFMGMIYTYAQQRILRAEFGEGGIQPGSSFRRIIQNGPAKFLLLGAVAAVSTTAIFGYLVGQYVVNGILGFRQPKLNQTALLTNGELIRDIRLVSTTTKAAMVLVKTDSSENGTKTITLDRANILCIDTGSQCTDFKPEQMGSQPDRVVTYLPALESREVGRFINVQQFASTLGCSPLAHAIELPDRLFFDENDASCPVTKDHLDSGDSRCVKELPSPGPLVDEATEVLVIGLSSSTGLFSHNLDLGERRAFKVARLLRQAGWSNVRATALGESLFVDRAVPAEGDDFPAAPKDRRVEIFACSSDMAIAKR